MRVYLIIALFAIGGVVLTLINECSLAILSMAILIIYVGIECLIDENKLLKKEIEELKEAVTNLERLLEKY